MSNVNSEYKNSHIWEIPDKWSIVKLGDICEIRGRVGWKGYTKNDLVDNGPLALGAMHINDNNKLDLSQPVYLSREKYEESPEIMVSKGDILLVQRGSLGKVVLIEREIGEATINPSMVLLKDIKINNKYLYYFLCSEYIQKIIFKDTSQTSIPMISQEQIRKFNIVLANISEQEKIVEILSTWDSAIEKQEQLTEKKKEFKKGLTQKLLAGEVRFKTVNGEEFPRWKKVKLGDHLIKHNEKSEMNNQYPVLTSSRKGIFLQSEYYSGNEVASEDNTGYNVVPRGYFTYRHMSDDLIFKFNINDIVDKGIVSTLYPVFTVKDMDSYFLRVKLNEGDEFKRYAQAQKQGGSRTYMYFSKLETLKLNIPCLEEQKKISEVLKESDKELELLEKELEAIKLQKKGLMQRLLTGEVRVKI